MTPVTWIRIHSRPLNASEKHTPTAGISGISVIRMRGDKPVSTGRTGGAERRPSYPGDQRVKHANRATKIWVKVALGIAYFLCVSIAAFFLAIYYVFFWTPDGHNNATKTETASTDSIICHWKKLLQLFLTHYATRPDTAHLSVRMTFCSDFAYLKWATDQLTFYFIG